MVSGKNIRQGMTLVEVLMALVILAIAVLPVISALTQYYGVASRQFDNETALKLAEAAMNKILAHKYSALAKGETFSLPLDFSTPDGTVAGALSFSGGNATSGPIEVGKITYNISVETQTLFFAQNIDAPHDNALEFKFAAEPPLPPIAGSPPPPPTVASYSCFDDLIGIRLIVEYGGPKDRVELAAFRADMSQ
jgi:prepilin-type N-terminal cleavage/methylation domain-containing protein